MMNEAQESKLNEALNIVREHFDGAVIVVQAVDESSKEESHHVRWTTTLPHAFGLLEMGKIMAIRNLKE
jgi:hypothetical protein